jgi:hypothetical protein
MAAHPAEHAQQDATLRTMALGTLIFGSSGTRPLHTVPLQCHPK